MAMKQSGVTLIEMMIVVVIIGLLAVAASPFTSEWVKQAHVAGGVAAMEEAIGRAKTAAMRNAAGIRGENPASMLCISSADRLELIVPANATQALRCDLPPVWTAQTAGTVDIKVDNATWACSCFNNKGLPTVQGDCQACSARMTFQFFSSGAERENHSFN